MHRPDRLYEFTFDGPTSETEATRAGFVVAAMVVGLLAAFGVCIVTGAFVWTMVVAFLTIIVAQAYFGVVTFRHWRRLRSPDELPGPPDNVGFRPSVKPADALAGIFRDRHVGRTFLLRSIREPFDTSSIRERTEPIRLNELDPAFRALRYAVTGRGDDGSEGETLSPLRVVRRWLVAGGQSSLVGFAPLLVVLPTNLLNPKIPQSVFLYGVMACIVASLALFVFLAHAQSTFFVVPGGLVVRKSRKFSTRASFRLWTPDEAILTVHPMAMGEWQFSLHRRMEAVGGTITRAEAEMLIRFWLSNVPPPDDEALRTLMS